MNLSCVLSVHHLTIRHGTNGEAAADGLGPAALHDVSFTLAAGSWTAVAGANGSGKSTLARAIAGLMPISAGRIDRKEGTVVSIVLQHPETQLLGDTVLEEIRMGLKNGETLPDAVLRELAEAILDEAGLDVPLDLPVEQLSGGQKQLLNIAGCLAAQADIAVFDEAAAMLDPASRDRVLQAVRTLHGKGCAVVWITHNSEELVYADRVLLLEQGRLACDLPAADFLYGTSPGEPGPCERAGMELPFVVHVVKQLESKGVRLAERPLLPDELSLALNAYADHR